MILLLDQVELLDLVVDVEIMDQILYLQVQQLLHQQGVVEVQKMLMGQQELVDQVVVEPHIVEEVPQVQQVIRHQ
jgi:hypothetical protein